MVVLGILLLAGALALSRVENFAPIENWRSAPRIAKRLTHLVPVTDTADGEDPAARAWRPARRLARRIDPTFKAMESELQTLGVVAPRFVMLIEAARVAGALGLAAAGGLAVNARAVPAFWLACPFFYGAGLALSMALLRALSRKRRRRILNELILGMGLLGVFLEGGQSLGQALRAFAGICGHALPTLCPVQKALVADLDNGLAYDKALERWAARLAVEQGRLVASLFLESLTHGSELAPQLRQLAHDIWEQRLMAARESMGAKSAQLTLVMVAFFLPAILAFIAGPPIAALVTGLGGFR